MNLGEKILQLRKKKNWSQPELGKTIGTSGPIIGKYERNEMKPSIDVVKKISEAFKVSIDYLVDESNEVSILKDKSMLTRLSQLDEINSVDREKILDVVDSFIRDSMAKKAYQK